MDTSKLVAVLRALKCELKASQAGMALIVGGFLRVGR